MPIDLGQFKKKKVEQEAKIIEKKPIFQDVPPEVRLIEPESKLIGDKKLDKTEICDYIAKYLIENKDNFTLDWLRGQKLTFEAVNEIRKKK